MGFLWGFIMFFICHTVANIFENNLYCYIQEEKADDVNRYAMKQYLTKAIISFVVYIAIFIVALTAKTFSQYTSAILIGNGIGFFTASIHFRLIAEDNYIKQKAKNEWNSWDHMSFDEKRAILRKHRETNTENTHFEASTGFHPQKSSHYINNERFEGSVAESQSYIDIIAAYFKNEKGLKADIEVMPNGEKIVTVNYQMNYLWTLYIKIDEFKEIIEIYTPFFKVASLRQNNIYELLNEWNRKFFFIKFSFEDAIIGPFVLASSDIPLTSNESIGKFVFDIADIFIRTIDDQFNKVPKDIIGH